MKRTPLKRKTPLRAKKRPVVKRKPKKRTKSLSLLKKRLWAECKRIIRLRYQKHNGTWDCFTCGANLDEPKKAQTGHFIPSSVCSTEMRYDLDNLRIQDYRCNINFSGNWPEYEKRLNQEMGEGFTDRLKKRNEETKGKQYDSIWYQNKIEEYKKIV